VKDEKSIEPLVYQFESNYLFYPIAITGFSEVGGSRAEINLFLVTSKQSEIPDRPYSYRRNHWFSSYGHPVGLTNAELTDISERLASLFEDGAKVSKTSIYGKLSEITRDLILYPYSWSNNLTIGDKGERVKALQKILINEGFWNSEVEATDYFGPITKAAVMRFQQRHAEQILKPLGLEKATGLVGPSTRSYLKTRDQQQQQQGEVNSCETDQDCVLVNENCCPCSMGGGKKCINEDHQQQGIEDLDCGQENQICPAVYLCDSLPSGCECVDNKCQTSSE